MNSIPKIVVFLFFLSVVPSRIMAQGFYDEGTIQTIEIVFVQSNWDALLDAAEPTDAYVQAQSVTINGTVFNTVGVKYKGNSSYNANQVKNPFHIELDTYVNQDYQGYTDIKLSNVFADPSFTRETLSYAILRQYMHAPLANYARVYVNGTYIGLYTNVESISKKFVDNHFGSNGNAFFDCSPPNGAGPTTTNLPNLAYLGTDSASYTSAYDMKSLDGWNDLINLTNILNNDVANVETVLDVDRALWMLAFDNVMVNLDSYLGRFKQNYYLYKDDYGRFNPIIWDLNMCFGVFSDAGTVNFNTTAAKRQMTHTLHSSDAAWPLVVKLLSVPSYKRKYLAHYKTILNENIANNSYYTKAQNYQTLITSAVTADVNKFFTTAQFTANLTTDVSGGGGGGGMTAPGLSNLMSGRSTYLSALSDFTASQPTIASITAVPAAPSLGSPFTMRATVTNANASSVYIGYRYNAYAPFTKVQLYDDGAHDDGAAGDNVYGASLTLSYIAMQYYIYAENNTIGKFAPERAEHEFYTLTGNYSAVSAGQVVINEFMAQNTATVTDEVGEFEDWVELYNNMSYDIDLGGYYLSDNTTNLTKWQFPANTIIPANGYLIVWADDEAADGTLHAAWKLSASGESVTLANPSLTVIDQFVFGAQTTDMGNARVPNGTGNFVIQSPTFNANNSPALHTIEVQEPIVNMVVFPNPAKATVNVVISDLQANQNIRIYNQLGQLVSDVEADYQNTIDIFNLSLGTYIVTYGSLSKKLVILN